MIIELDKLGSRDLTELLESTLAHTKQLGFILVDSLPDEPPKYYCQGAPDGLKEFGGVEQPTIHLDRETVERVVNDFKRNAPAELQNQHSLSAVLWINPTANSHTVAMLLGRVFTPSEVGDIFFDATGSDKQAQDAEASAQRSEADKLLRDQAQRRNSRGQPRRDRNRRRRRSSW